MKNPFYKQTERGNPPKSTFDMSHEHKTSLDIGKIIPIFWEECLPGDDWKINVQQMLRFSPLISPVYHRINVHINAYKVPMRLLMEKFDDFIRGDEEILVPQKALSDVLKGSLADYLGLPPGEYRDSTQYINLMPFIAYHKIWNEYYRNDLIQEPYDIEEWLEHAFEYECWSARYEKDYFNSCTPYAQQGTEATALGNLIGAKSIRQIDNDPATDNDLQVKSGRLTGYMDEELELYGDESVEVHISELRKAEALQKVLEKITRIGNKYSDWLRSFWGEDTRDLRIDVPEWIGGGKYPVVISEVLNTTGQMGTELLPEGLPQGNMSGHALSTGQDTLKCHCEEYSYIMITMHVLPEVGYMSQGLEKKWTRFAADDFPLPEYAQLGQQEVNKKELLYRNIPEHDNAVFGYNDRYSELKGITSKVSGEFRDTLKFWHLNREFDKGNPVQLTTLFQLCQPADQSRIFAVETATNEQLYAQIYFDAEVRRSLPYNSIPSI